MSGVTGGKTGKPTGSPMSGGGRMGEPVIGIGVAGEVAEPLSNTGWGMPAMLGGTGAGWIGGEPLDTVGLRNRGEAAAGDDDVLAVGDDQAG